MVEKFAVKKLDKATKYTQAQIDELLKCKQDFIYFVMNYVYITHPTCGKLKFEPYDYQYTMLESFLNHRNIILLCGRQLGKCVQSKTSINTIKKPKGLKKLILKIFYRKTYNEIFKKSKAQKSEQYRQNFKFTTCLYTKEIYLGSSGL